MSRLEVSLTATSYGTGVTAPLQGTQPTVGWFTTDFLGYLQFTVAGPGAAFPNLFTTLNHGLTSAQPVYVTLLSGVTNGQPQVNPPVLYFADTTHAPTGTNSQDVYFLSTTAAGAVAGTGHLVPNANGAGQLYPVGVASLTQTIYLQPQRYGESWRVDRIIVQNTSQIKVPTATVYRGTINPAAIVDSTSNARNNVDDLNAPITLNAGEPLIVQFTGCDVPVPSGTTQSIVYLAGEVTRQ